MLVPFYELSERQLHEVVAIYEEALAAPWEWPSARFYELARTTGGPLWAMAALEDDSAVGFIINEYLPGGRLWYVHYFAVRANLRGQGLGARTLTASLPHGEEAARRHGHEGCIAVVLEVEAIDSPPEDADREQRMRRQAFYRRQGALASGALYPRPPWAPAEMPDWDLLFIPMSGWNGRVDDALRHRLIRSVAVEGYDTPEETPWLVAVLEPFTRSK